MVHMTLYVCLLLSWIQCTINESHNTSKGYIRYLILVSGMQAKEYPMILNPLIVILKYLINRVWELEPTTEALYNRCDYA